jgi:hypothetical protein
MRADAGAEGTQRGNGVAAMDDQWRTAVLAPDFMGVASASGLRTDNHKLATASSTGLPVGGGCAEATSQPPATNTAAVEKRDGRGLGHPVSGCNACSGADAGTPVTAGGRVLPS